MKSDNIKDIWKYIPTPISQRAKEYLQTMPRTIWQNRMLNMTAYHNYYMANMRYKFECKMASKWWKVIHFNTFSLLEFMYEWRNAFLWPTQTLDDYLHYKGYYPTDYMYEFFKKDVDMKEVRRLDNVIENYNKKHSVMIVDGHESSVKQCLELTINKNRRRYTPELLAEALERFRYVDTDIFSEKYDILLPDKKLSRSRVERELWKSIVNSTYGAFGGIENESKKEKQ